MKKFVFYLSVPVFFMIALSSCKKEISKSENELQVLSKAELKTSNESLPFEVHIKTWYRIAPNPSPQPIVVNGTTYYTFTFFPGAGTGTATYLGNVTNYFNQLAYGVSPIDPPVGSISAPVSDVPSYPITGYPLPFIQAGDFSGLAKDLNPLKIPRDVNGDIVNSVIYSNNGHAIFTSAINSTSTTFPVPGNPTLVGFSGDAKIVGGKGKFKNATGLIKYTGYFNVVNPNDAEYNAVGKISY